MNRILLISLLILFVCGCNKEKYFDGPNTYSDSFEVYSAIDELVDGNNEQWSFFQLTSPGNMIRVDTHIVHSGNKSIRFDAAAGSDGNASKSSINKQFMAFWEGETVIIDFWVYLEGNESAEWLFLFDLEEKAAISAGPGMRLAIVEDALLVEHKYPKPNIVQPETSRQLFPRDTWVNIRFETLLSQKNTGWVKVWQDGGLIIEKYEWQTLPRDILYFQQGTKGMYNQVEFGLTANSQASAHTLFLDDVSISTQN